MQIKNKASDRDK